MNKQRGLFVFLTIMFTIAIFCPSSLADTELYTRILTINDEYSFIHGVRSGECLLTGTRFSFAIETEIWNPSKEPFNVTTPNLLTLLDPGVEIQFENESYCYQAGRLGIIPAFGGHSIPSGLTTYESGIVFSISPGNLTSLPFGNYTFWSMISGHETEFEYLETYLTVNSSGEFYSNEEIPSNWGSLISETITLNNYEFKVILIVLVCAFLKKASHINKKR